MAYRKNYYIAKKAARYALPKSSQKRGFGSVAKTWTTIGGWRFGDDGGNFTVQYNNTTVFDV